MKIKHRAILAMFLFLLYAVLSLYFVFSIQDKIGAWEGVAFTLTVFVPCTIFLGRLLLKWMATGEFDIFEKKKIFNK